MQRDIRKLLQCADAVLSIRSYGKAIVRWTGELELISSRFTLLSLYSGWYTAIYRNMIIIQSDRSICNGAVSAFPCQMNTIICDSWYWSRWSVDRGHINGGWSDSVRMRVTGIPVKKNTECLILRIDSDQATQKSSLHILPVFFTRNSGAALISSNSDTRIEIIDRGIGAQSNRPNACVCIMWPITFHQIN